MKKSAKKRGRIALGALALGLSAPACGESCPPEVQNAPEKSESMPATHDVPMIPATYVSTENTADMLSPVDTSIPARENVTRSEITALHPNGEYTKEELDARMETLPNGAKLLNDAGVYFYKVIQNDNPSAITQTLARDPRFAHLKTRGYGVTSYNASPKRLAAGMWLPIPPRERDAYVVSDTEFLSAASRAIARLESHPVYRKEIGTLLKMVSRKNLEAGMLAVAKMESGGGRVGELSPALWDPNHQTFSLSVFHVLMEGAGLDARKKLGMTQGQLFYPENASALFLAFLCEKGDPSSLFPIDRHAADFAAFYNGASWKKYNPTYASDLLAAYRSAQKGPTAPARSTRKK